MKFNILKRKTARTFNHENAPAWEMGKEMELYAAVVTSALENAFYEKAEDRMLRIRTLIAANDPEFVARLAVYARQKMNLRSIPLVLCVELARLHKGDSLVSRMTAKVIQRADEITELLAYYQSANTRNEVKKLNKLSKQLQKGLAEAFNRFDEYQFAKYDRAGAVKLRDALFLVHPKPANKAQQAIFNKIASATLETPYTWEVELSVLGQKNFDSPEEKAAHVRAKWEELIGSGRLGYMALLRNLRNILLAGVSDACMAAVCTRLADAAEVARSKQLPFRFLSAYREVEAMRTTAWGAPDVLDALEKAVKASAANIAGFGNETRVLIAADVSGSMYQPVSARSSVAYYDIGLMLGMMLQSRCSKALTGIFGESFKMKNLPKDHILANVMKLRSIEGEVGYATNGHLVIKYLLDKRLQVDKVMMFTDAQMWDSTGYGNTLEKYWAQYKKAVAPDAQLYLFDLAGYGQAPLRIPAKDVYLIAGWSDKIFDVLEAIGNGSSALSEIKRMEL